METKTTREGMDWVLADETTLRITREEDGTVEIMPREDLAYWVVTYRGPFPPSGPDKFKTAMDAARRGYDILCEASDARQERSLNLRRKARELREVFDNISSI